jgi:hypothetical protein
LVFTNYERQRVFVSSTPVNTRLSNEREYFSLKAGFSVAILVLRVSNRL